MGYVYKILNNAWMKKKINFSYKRCINSFILFIIFFLFKYLFSCENHISHHKDRLIRSRTVFVSHARFHLVCTCQLHAGMVTRVYVCTLPAYVPLSRSRIHASLLSVFRLAEALTWACGTGFFAKVPHGRESKVHLAVRPRGLPHFPTLCASLCIPSYLAPQLLLLRAWILRSNNWQVKKMQDKSTFSYCTGYIN